jgi:hypothetical protein
MILIVGAGGNGQTYFMEFLIKHNIHINSRYDYDGLKHLSTPNNLNKKIKKCIFLYNNPYDSLLSHYRRNWSYEQSCKLGNPYNLSEEQVNNYTTFKCLTLQKNKDIFGIEYQFNNWINNDLKIPILFLDFNNILNNIDILDTFLNKKLNYNLFKHTDRHLYKHDEIYNIYEKLYKYMNNKLNT